MNASLLSLRLGEPCVKARFHAKLAKPEKRAAKKKEQPKMAAPEFGQSSIKLFLDQNYRRLFGVKHLREEIFYRRILVR